MKISNIIMLLEMILEKHGNINVRTEDLIRIIVFDKIEQAANRNDGRSR